MTEDTQIIDDDRPTAYYSVGQIGAASLLGGVIAGLWLLASNYRLFGEDGKAGRTWLTAWGGTIVMMIIVFLLPKNSMPVAMPAIIGACIHGYAKREQGAQIDAAKAKGIPQKSNWVVLAITVAGIAAVLVTAFIAVFIFNMLAPAHLEK